MAVLALGFAVDSPAGAAEAAVGRGVIAKATRKLEPRDAASVANAGTRVLVHVAEARGAIRARDAGRAREAVRRAEKLLDVMRSSLPTAVAKDRIWVARRHLEYEGPQQVLPDLVAIDSELVLLRNFVPTAEARSHLEIARGHLERGDAKAGLDELKAADAAVVYEEVDLPLSETQAHLSRALSELAIGATEKADSALRAAERSAQVIVAAVREPHAKEPPPPDTATSQWHEEE
jgi:hypothetical protein